MMKKLTSYMGLFILLLALSACGGDHGVTGPGTDPDPDPDPPLTTEAKPVDIKINLPQGVDLDLSTTTLLSFLEKYDVAEDGSTKAIYNEGSNDLAVLLDQEDNPLLMGFITKDHRELSVKSTAEAAFYFSLGTIFLPEEVKARYLEDSSSLPGFDKFVKDAETLFTNDKNFLSSDAFLTLLTEQTSNIINDANSIDIDNLPSATLNLDSKDIKSGIQMNEREGLSVSIVNFYRRRAHAFLYKTRIIKEDGTKGGKPEILIDDIAGSNAQSLQDVAVSPTKEFTSLTGATADLAGGTGIGFGRTETKPLPLQLDDDQIQATYKVRVVGPSFQLSSAKLTKTENEKLGELTNETLAFDLVLPFILSVVGNTDLLKGLDEKGFQGFKNAVTAAAASVPSINSAIKEGNLKKAFYEFIASFANNFIGGSIENVLEELQNGIEAFSEAKGSDYFAQNAKNISAKFQSTNKILAVVDAILLANDVIVRQGSAYAFSSKIDEWEVTARQSKVTLTPGEAVAFPGISADFEAVAQDVELGEGQVFEYEWSTTGKFGVLEADIGNKHGTSFVSSQAKVKYKSTVTDDELDENSIDSVFVEVFVREGQKRTRVNADSAIVRVRPFKIKIKPDGIKVQGNTNVRLYLEFTDGKPVITDDSFLDYKVVWSTPGSHGQLEGRQTTVTTLNRNDINYRATDRGVKEATEAITARIYSSKKGAQDYSLIDEVEGRITISNDPNKRYFVVPIGVHGTPPNKPGDIYINFGVTTAFKFTPLTGSDIPAGFEVASTTIQIKERIPEPIPSCNGDSRTFIPGQEDSRYFIDGQYMIFCAGSGGSYLDPGKAQARYAELLALYKTFEGYAQVTVTFKAKE